MKLIITDIDGVLTNGQVTIDKHGNETKTICYRDLDAINIGRRAGYEFAFVTGEDSPMTHLLAQRFTVDRLYTGVKDKLTAIRSISIELDIPLNNLLYIGDSDRDVPALAIVGLAIVPYDATPSAKKASHLITQCKGGYGVLLEVINKLQAEEWKYPNS